jgi:pyridoxal phosphate enzyme (YggS family)
LISDAGVPDLEAIRRALTQVQRRMTEAAERAGRDPGGVRLVVITKGYALGALQALIECGPRRLGENRVEEALPKIDALGPGRELEWHLVGPLQSRKVPLVDARFELIHSVDRLKIARRLDQLAASLGRPQAVLLECNVSGEPSKAGWRFEDEATRATSLREIEQVLSFRSLIVLGLMTMAPQTDDVATQRRTFRRLAELNRRLRDDFGRGLPELSMGMSDDFEPAIEEGATIVRIGRAILGERM